MSTRLLRILLLALYSSLHLLNGQSGTAESNLFSLDTRSFTVSFELGSQATRTGGGALQQTVLSGQAATAPTLAVTDGWVFEGWSVSFSSVTANLTVTARIGTNTTDDDGDGLSYYEEVIVYGSDPNKRDSSGDGFSDGELVGLGLDPNTDHSGIVELAREDRCSASEILELADQLATLQILLEQSDDQILWSDRETIDLVLPPELGERVKFLRYTAQWLTESPFPVPEDADRFAFIPAGPFTMGDGLDGLADAPEHEVNLSGFYIGTHEVSWALWQEVRDWATRNAYTDLSWQGLRKADEHPVQHVNWYDVVKWCNAASERAGLEPVYYVSEGGGVYRSGEIQPYIDYSKQGYRLPTEAEWEKAARGGLIGKRFSGGDTICHGDANYWSTSLPYDAGSGAGYHPDYHFGKMPYTAPVGSLAANGCGLYHMSGNLKEWCNDLYDSSYYSSSPEVDPKGPSTGRLRVLRGGCWFSNASFCRVAYRNNDNPAYRFIVYGFRLALNQ